MKKAASIFLALSFYMLSTATLASAGSRYYGDYRYPYRGHRAPYSYHYGHSHHGGSFLPLLGFGLLTGAVVGSMIYEQPRQPTVVYTNPPPPVYVQSEPRFIDRPVVAYASPQLEVVLKQVKMTARIVNVRSGPGLDSNIIGQALSGETVDVIGAAPDWLYIKTRTGQYGWVMSQYTVESGRPVG